MNWKRPNTVTGPVAQGKKYFRREDIEDKIWHELSQSNSVLFLAPRRVGKSSIVSYMAENPLEGFIGKYEDIESDASLQDFYKRMVRMIHDSLSNYGKGKKWVTTWWNSWTLKTIGKDKVDIGKAEVDYKVTFFELLNELMVHNEKVVLFLDEFPDVVLRLFEKHGEDEAIQLLNDVRSLCHDEKFKNTFVLVLLGSVGLAHIVKKITGRSHKINQVHKVFLPPLEKEYAIAFLNFLIEGASMQLDEPVKEYLLNKIGNYIPFYIQLIIEECDDILRKDQRPTLSPEDVDYAYNNLLKKNEHFQDWDERLSKYFPDKFPFLNKVLARCADNDSLSLHEVYDIAVALNIEIEWKANIDDILIADGYIYVLNGHYYFNSPLLRDWWKSRHPIMKK
ncbi:MAG: hypothetical protein R2774_04040 [Saprospiraceae bacterium]